MIYELDLPMRTPTLNVWQRMHWSRRRKIGQSFAVLIRQALGHTPDRPLKRCRITVRRESTQEPDRDGLVGGLKPLLDALQPRCKRHPYGQGVIIDDAPTCVLSLDVGHVHGKGARTWIRIEDASDE